MIEFEHGTTSGSRVLRVDRQVRGGGREDWQLMNYLPDRIIHAHCECDWTFTAKVDLHIRLMCVQEVLRRDWMFKLVGGETFQVGKNSLPLLQYGTVLRHINPCWICEEQWPYLTKACLGES